MDQVDAGGKTTTLIHFVHEVNGKYQIVCMPNMTEFHKTGYHPVYLRSNDARAVTCPQCKSTTEVKNQLRIIGAGGK